MGPADNFVDDGSPTPAIAWSHGRAGRSAGERRTRGDEGPARLGCSPVRASITEWTGRTERIRRWGSRGRAAGRGAPMAETCQWGGWHRSPARTVRERTVRAGPKVVVAAEDEGACGRPASAPSAGGTASVGEHGAQAAGRVLAGLRGARHRRAAVGRWFARSAQPTTPAAMAGTTGRAEAGTRTSDRARAARWRDPVSERSWLPAAGLRCRPGHGRAVSGSRPPKRLTPRTRHRRSRGRIPSSRSTRGRGRRPARGRVSGPR